MVGCWECPPGQLAKAVGSSSCKVPCTKGSFRQTGQNMTECTLCSPGTVTVKEDTGNVACMDCLAGKYSPAQGQTQCLVCPNGTYSPGLRAKLCTQCTFCKPGEKAKVECSPTANRVCEPISCSTPPTVNNAVASGRARTYGSKVTFSCNTNYKGGGNVECKANGQWTDAPKCHAAGAPTCAGLQVLHGTTPLSQVKDKGSKLNVTCNKGYLPKSQMAMCVGNDTDLTWAYQVCKPADCGDCGGVANSKRLGNATTYGSSFSFICTLGHEVKGRPSGQSFGASIVCPETGKWETKPVCSPVDCGSPPPIDNAKVTLAKTSATTFGSTANVVCDADRGFSGVSTIECLASRKWSSPGMCTTL